MCDTYCPVADADLTHGGFEIRRRFFIRATDILGYLRNGLQNPVGIVRCFVVGGKLVYLPPILQFSRNIIPAIYCKHCSHNIGLVKLKLSIFRE